MVRGQIKGYRAITIKNSNKHYVNVLNIKPKITHQVVIFNNPYIS